MLERKVCISRCFYLARKMHLLLLCFGGLLTVQFSAGVATRRDATIEKIKTIKTDADSSVEIKVSVPIDGSQPISSMLPMSKRNDKVWTVFRKNSLIRPFSTKKDDPTKNKCYKGDIEAIHQGSVELNKVFDRKIDPVNKGDKVLASCPDWHFLIGESVSTCTKDGWNPSALGFCAPVCPTTILQESGDTTGSPNNIAETCGSVTVNSPGIEYNFSLPGAGTTSFYPCSDVPGLHILWFDQSGCLAVVPFLAVSGCGGYFFNLPPLPAGDYTVKVAGTSASAIGAFDLRITCD